MNRTLLLMIVLSFFIVGLISCSKEGVNNPVGNQPPDTGFCRAHYADCYGLVPAGADELG